MPAILFQIFIALVGVALTGFAAVMVWRSKRRLDLRLQQFKAEQEAQRSTPGAVHPYAQLAELYQEAPPENAPAPRFRKRPR